MKRQLVTNDFQNGDRRRKPPLPHVQSFAGYHYFRRTGFRRVRLPGLPFSPEFMAAYQEAMAQPIVAPSARRGGSERLSKTPLIGVYLLMLKGKVIYVGSSLHMPRRVAQHRANGRPFDDAFYIATTALERLRLESTLIAAIAPSGNRRGVVSEDTIAKEKGPRGARASFTEFKYAGQRYACPGR